MRAVVQRVKSAEVRVDGDIVGSISRGLLVLLAVGREDAETTAQSMAMRIAGLRIFEDENGRMNLSVADVGGAILCVSQFTLYGDVRRGRRPSFDGAAEPAQAEHLYDVFCDVIAGTGLSCEKGVFRARMEVDLVNEGPVTIWLDSADLQRPRR